MSHYEESHIKLSQLHPNFVQFLVTMPNVLPHLKCVCDNQSRIEYSTPVLVYDSVVATNRLILTRNSNNIDEMFHETKWQNGNSIISKKIVVKEFSPIEEYKKNVIENSIEVRVNPLYNKYLWEPLN